MTRSANIRRLFARWSRDTRGAAAVEFVLVVPLMLAIYLGGYEVSNLVSTYRKVCDATAQLADIASQMASPTDQSTLNTQMAATTQIMSPFSTTKLTIALSEITADSSGAGTVTWCEAYQGATCLTKGASYTLPAALKAAAIAAGGASYLLVVTNYTYDASFGASWTGPSIPLSDQLYIPPRNVASITCKDC
ncbi:MAG: TadE/TadG family type IV pilus assembly protein [Caulobacteraceae bacterium]